MPLADFEAQVIAPRRAAIVRIYTDVDSKVFGINKSDTDAAVKDGKIPLSSFKGNPYSIEQLANDVSLDSVFAEQVAYLRSLAPHTVWVSFFHEPEDNFTTPDQQALFRRASRRFNLAVKAAGLTNVAVVGPIYMGVTFRGSRDWRVWNPDWDGKKWLSPSYDLEGVDLYDPQIGAATRKTVSYLLQPFLDKIVKERPGDFRPYVVGELGVKTMVSLPDPDNGGHTNTLDEYFSDLTSFVDRTTSGVSTPMVAMSVWLKGSANEKLIPFQSNTMPPSVVDEVNRLNPGGWPNSSYYPEQDPGGRKKAALLEYILNSPLRADVTN